MDVLNEAQLRKEVVDPAISRLNGETIPAVQAALHAELQFATSQLDSLGQSMLQGLRSSVTAALAEVSSVVAQQDGWTLEIGPITIPAISIRLTKPKS